MKLNRLWLGVLTRNVSDADTDDHITLTINTAGVERLSHTFPDTSQSDLERGQANVYEVDVRDRGIDSSDLTDSSIRIGIRGDDAWLPEHIFLWGEGVGSPAPAVIPIAMEWGIRTTLSTDAGEGPASMPLRLVSHGGAGMRMQRLLMLMVTTGSADDDSVLTDPNPALGTTGALEIQVVRNNSLALLFDIAATPQNDLDTGEANFYTAPAIVPFARQELADGSITLRITGNDDWWPASFFMFGLESAAGRSDKVVPLVHLPKWPFGGMIPDPTNGYASIALPLLPSRFIVGDDLLGATLTAVVAGQDRIISLLEELTASKCKDR